MRYGLVVTVLAGLTAPAAAEHVWIEAENPTKATVAFQSTGWGHQEYLSGGKWLYGSVEAKDLEAKIPAEGATLAYAFTANGAGAYEVWGRIGYEFVRSPFRWRIDQGPWQEVTPDQLTTDLMAIAEWTEVAWLQFGKADLAAGLHTLELKFERRYAEKGGKKEPQRILFGFDCFCLSREPFLPNGPHQPGSDWRKPIDREAADRIIDVRPTAGPERTVQPLGGLWQIARWDENAITDRTGPTQELPPNVAALPWKGLRVPGDKDHERPDLAFCHRYLCRTRIRVPADLKGKAFILHFPSTCLIASVLVNGQYCGYSKAPTAAWDCDVTAAVRPGEVNEVVVVIKDLYYALAEDGQGRSCRYLFNFPHERFHNAGGLNATRFADFPVLFKVRRNGILETPALIVTGPAYVADVFVQPSVQRKRLRVEFTIRNSGPKAGIEISHEIESVEPGLQKVAFREAAGWVMEAGKALTLTHNSLFPDGRLWWPDDPVQYYLVTRLKRDGQIIDVQRTKFGFREWGWQGQSFTLNGIPWHFRADLLHHDRRKDAADADRAAAEWRKTGVNTFRFWGDEPWYGASQEETLDWFDAHGMPVRRSGIFDGEIAPYLLVDKGKARKDLFDNWILQMEAWVKAERNHPSVFIWSLENEITYINTRNLGWLDQVEPEIKRAAAAVMKLDPTRPVMIDGGDALRDRSLPVYGNHYNEGPWREYPDEAYTMARAFNRYQEKPEPHNLWRIGDDRPLFLGESYFANGSPAGAYAQVMGEAAFLGRNQARPGVELLARMLAEGYRWHGVAAFHFWFAHDASASHYQAFQPVCVLVREWNSALAGGQPSQRTLKVFNDTRSAEPIEATWRFSVGGKTVREETKVFELAPGTAQEWPITLPAVPVQDRTKATLELTCQRKGQEVFRDRKGLVVVVTEGAKPQAAVAVYDPRGAVRARLQARGVAFTAVADLDKVPREARVIVIGPDALTARQATDPIWMAWAAQGKRVLVLDQQHPLHYQAVPADLEPTRYAGRIAFPENLEHPTFAGLEAADFFTWSGDHVCYRNAYKKAARGAKSLVQCDEELSCSALAECGVKDGLLLLCQLAVGTKLAGDPVAQRLFDNLLHYAATYQPAAKQVAAVFPAGDLRLKLLEASGVKLLPPADLMAALKGPAEIVMADASPAHLRALAANAEPLKAFTDRGGYLMLWGLTPEGLADYNRVVGYNHVLRPFKLERVTLPAQRDPLIAGLTARDVVLESNEKIYPWAGDRYLADDVFTQVVDVGDIAPFCRSPQYAHGWSQMTNGLTSADSWKFIFYHDLGKADPKPKWSADLPKECAICGFGIVINAHYHKITKLRLVFDDDPKTALDLDLKPEAELRQDFEINRQKCRKITLEPLAWTEPATQPVIGIDNVWLPIRMPPGPGIRPLLNVGGLVKYQRGRGGILLNQLKIQASEANPENAQKKQTIVATLLRNLGAAFAGERTVVPGANLSYWPIPLGEKCNQFLTADKGWLPGQPDLRHFPAGEVKLAGVTYQVRDFKTSPLPSCVMLGGAGAKSGLPQEVTGIPVGGKADVLFFLHTFHQAADWRPDRNQKEEPPAVWQYVVHYADGQTATVPVRLGRGVAHWQQAEPQGLPEASVAWAAPFPMGPQDRQAVVYQMSWANPRPGAEIRSLDIRFDPKAGGRYGTPVLFGVTAGTAAE